MSPALRVLLWVGAGLALASAVAALALLWWLFGAVHGGVDIRINGQPLTLPELQGWRDWSGAADALGPLLGALAMVIAVPLLLLVLLVLGTLAGTAGIAGVLLAVALVTLLALSPLWLLLLLVWLVVRRRPATSVKAST